MIAEFGMISLYAATLHQEQDFVYVVRIHLHYRICILRSHWHGIFRRGEDRRRAAMRGRDTSFGIRQLYCTDAARAQVLQQLVKYISPSLDRYVLKHNAGVN